MTVRRYGLRDDHWDRIKDLLPGREGTVGRPAVDNRLFVEAVLYRYRAGIPWRDLPERFGDFRVVHTRFSRRTVRGVWKAVFEHLAKDADNEYAMIDSTIVRAQKGGQSQAIGRSKGGLSTKIHTTVDALGNPTGADVLLPQLEAKTVIADKGFEADKRVLDPLKQVGKQACHPAQSKSKHATRVRQGTLQGTPPH
jgi:transposase